MTLCGKVGVLECGGAWRDQDDPSPVGGLGGGGDEIQGKGNRAVTTRSHDFAVHARRLREKEPRLKAGWICGGGSFPICCERVGDGGSAISCQALYTGMTHRLLIFNIMIDRCRGW